jgi:dihydroorotate dehydrogenase (NAD+) catalytic subunit
MINTLRAYAPAPDGGGRAWLGGGTGGLSGPAIRSVALAQVSLVARTVSIPVVGMGGVQSGAHARDLLDAGAVLVAVGTENFRDPAAGGRIARELAEIAVKSGQSRSST